MLNAKLGLSAALLEINAWSGPLLFESNSDLVLLWYLGGHALASLLLAAFVQALLAQRNGLRVLDSFGLQDGRTVRFAPNLRAGTSVYKLAR